MITSVHDWLVFLKGSQSLIGFPLIVGGLGLMLFGWRLWKVCVMLSFGLIGAALGAAVAGPGDYQALYAVAGGVVLGVVSYWPVNYAVALLGGLVGAAVIAQALSVIGLHGPPLWISAGLALFVCTAVAFLNRRHVLIGITAFIGAVLVISGLAAFVMRMPGLYGTLHTMATNNVIVVPFLLLVPTAMSWFYQEAEVRRTSADV